LAFAVSFGLIQVWSELAPAKLRGGRPEGGLLGLLSAAATADPKAHQAAADKLSAALIEKRLNYWSWLLGPKFSEKERQAINLRRDYSINQIEYCRNFIFKRHFPLDKIFERS
jgi:hypothetical protein